jgi:hypothetical protein
MFQALCASAEGMLYPEGRESWRLLARQYRNLSLNQALRIYSLANCIRVALDHAILFLSSRGHEKAWEAVRFEIDRVQVHPNKGIFPDGFGLAGRLESLKTLHDNKGDSYPR